MKKTKPYTTTRLSPLENMIVTELQEAGSETIVTLAATAKNIFPNETLLSEFASAIRNLIKIDRVYFAKCEYSNFANRYIPIDQELSSEILEYLDSCNWEDWNINESYGPCFDIEVCTDE